jgi:serine protease
MSLVRFAIRCKNLKLKNFESFVSNYLNHWKGEMQIKNTVSLTQKTLYGVMLLGLFFSTFGAGNLSVVRAQEGSTEEPTIAAQSTEEVTAESPTETPIPTEAASLELPVGASSDQAIPTDRIIIKYKAKSNADASPMQIQQMQRLNNMGGITLKYLRVMSGNANVLLLPERLPLEQVQAISRKLMELPEVEYAEPDQLAFPMFTPNDPRYTNQWDLFGTYGINAPAAWNITTGSSSIVIADIDTGITNHVDLIGRTVPGYDFITDASMANDGGGRDSDPGDPGDWTVANECYAGSPAQNSTWHGTHTAGTIGASGNNSLGIAGINWVSKILPIRVLGKCGGYTSDIVDGMRWSAGLSVSGVSANPNPAKVLNMSLGGAGACDAFYQSAVDDIISAGAVIVVSAGNNAADAIGFRPANCTGVITVAAIDKHGYRAYYSNYGSSVDISAPGGDITNAPDGILSTLNTGTKSPVSDTYTYYQGTSMAAPHVSGVVSLMLSVNPSLTPANILQLLQSSVKAFPGGSTCNTSNCGSGILDAGAAVSAANAATAITISGNVGVGGATLSYDNSGPKTVTANGSGLYSIIVPFSWSGTVTPSLAGYIFSPANKSYTNVLANKTQNYIAIHSSFPGAFGKTSMSVAQSTSPTLSWSTSNGADSYEYCYDTTNDNACSSSWVSTGTTSSANLSGLSTNTTYYWQVRATNNLGTTYANGNETAYWSFTVTTQRPWVGTTSKGLPMSFFVSSSGTQWSKFRLKVDVSGCGLTMETTVQGPGTITDGQFDYSSSFSFTGQIDSNNINRFRYV